MEHRDALSARGLVRKVDARSAQLVATVEGVEVEATSRHASALCLQVCDAFPVALALT